MIHYTYIIYIIYIYVIHTTVVVAANGEIYNYKELYEEVGGDAFYKPKTGSDCEVVIPLYLKYGREFPNHLRGMFSFVVYDTRDDRYGNTHKELFF